MQKTWLCWLLLTASSTSLADWRPDKINLAFGQFISPLVERKAKIDQYRLSINWELTEALWSSDHVLLQSYMELAFSKWVSKLSDDSRRTGAKSARQASFSPVFALLVTVQRRLFWMWVLVSATKVRRILSNATLRALTWAATGNLKRA